MADEFSSTSSYSFNEMPLELTTLKQYLHFKDDAHHLLVLERIVELCDEMVLQCIHDVHLSFHIPSVATIGNAHEFGGQLQIGRFLPTSVHGAKLSSAKTELEFHH